MMSFKKMCLLAAMALMGTECAWSQWTKQDIVLRPGWNAVYLYVQPEPSDCDALFASAPFPVESVRAYNSAFSSVQYIQDLNSLISSGPPWIAWVPSNATERFANTLFRLDCGKAYFIKLPDGATTTTWKVVGKPVRKDIDWRADACNLVGFQLDKTNPPSFTRFFSGSPAHAGQPIYRMNTTGAWEQATGLQPMRDGEAFWIWLDEYSSYQGPVRVETDSRVGLDYGRTLIEQPLRFRNDFTNALTVHLRKAAADSVPAGVEPVKAGEVPLSYWTTNGWLNLPDELVVSSIQPGEERSVRLAVRRRDMTSITNISAGQEFNYQSLLEATDEQHLCRRLIPVVAKGLQSYDESGNPINPNAGLWVGSVAIDKVNQPTNTSDVSTPVATASEFQFRLIVHVDSNNQARLLQHVLLMWKDGTTNGMTNVPGHYVLVTDDRLADQFSGSTLRDGEQVGRRISSAAFAFRDPLPMLGLFGSTNRVLTCSVANGYNDPLNPFKHLYHPDHDNLDENFSTNAPRKAGVESYNVVREIELQFTDQDPEGLSTVDWGDGQVGGIWRETYNGLRHEELRVEGVFRLRQAAKVGVLNDGL
jgi:hypothetical protein